MVVCLTPPKKCHRLLSSSTPFPETASKIYQMRRKESKSFCSKLLLSMIIYMNIFPDIGVNYIKEDTPVLRLNFFQHCMFEKKTIKKFVANFGTHERE